MSTFEEKKAVSIQLMKELAVINMGLAQAVTVLMTTKAEELLSPLKDGTIDPGDKEQVMDHMMRILLELPEYAAVLQHGRKNRDKMAMMYTFFGELVADNYDEVINISQQGALDGAVEGMFQMLLQMNVVTDKRPGS